MTFFCHPKARCMWDGSDLTKRGRIYSSNNSMAVVAEDKVRSEVLLFNRWMYDIQMKIHEVEVQMTDGMLPSHEVFLTPTHLAIVMEYAAGGELLEKNMQCGRFSEDEARFFFQQLVSGGICHRDLKLENTLLDESPVPRMKICDFGYSKSSVLHSQPKSTVGTPAYIAPEVFFRKEYDGKIADVWSCGVTLYVMLVGAYPFEDPDEPRDFKKAINLFAAASNSYLKRLSSSFTVLSS